GNDVVLMHNNGTDAVRLKDWLTPSGSQNSSTQIEKITFADGTVWTPATLVAMGLTTLGTAGDDTLTGWAGNDTLVGGEGNDTLNGSTGANRLQGGAGNDVLSVHYNATGNVFEGGTGNDVMSGGYYADTYRFNLGDGQDTVIETYDYGTVDTVEFGAGIDQDDLWFHRVGNDLMLSFINSADSIEINDWFLGSANKVEATRFADGTTLTVAQVESLVAAMASYSPPAESSSSSGYPMSSGSEATLTHAS
ncbi:MAG: calcium-binding protein, partial [Lysobacter sp.]